MSAGSVLAEYHAKLQQIQTGIEHARAAQNYGLGLLCAAIALCALLLYNTTQRRVSVWCVALPLPVVGLAARWYATSRARWSRFLRLRNFYERGSARIEDRWRGNGFSGEEFRIANHVYDSDLRILGSGSLFELLGTPRTGIGRRRLAEYLLNPCDLNEALYRQDAVRELKSCGDLRERIALLGKYDFQESTWDVFAEWMHRAAMPVAIPVRVIAFAGSLVLGVLVLATFATNIPARTLLPWIPPILAVQLGIAWHFAKRTSPLNNAARRVGVEIAVMREGVELISSLAFRSPKLHEIQKRLTGRNASSSLRQLERLTNALAECDKPQFDLIAQTLIVRTQLCFAIEEWKTRNAQFLEQWLDAWAEFEALAAISGYAWENPGDVFPQFEEGDPIFVARGLGHPLIHASTCVGNDVALGAERRFYLVSGSNMAGKSTLMRSIGLNAILANVGAPVRAQSLRLTSLEVCASLSVVDSVLEGKSKFFAEVERVRQTIESTHVSPVLFLIDEILSGTNSRDRRIASESIVRALVKNGAIGVLSTHDLALTEIAELKDLRGENVHMGSRSGDDVMDFDYLIKPGVTTETNAMAIVALMGVSV